MKRRASIDLTPLLDVILLLVFGFMFILASTTADLEQSQQDKTALTSETTAIIETLESENSDLTEKNTALNTAIDNQAQDIDAIETAVQNFFEIDHDALEKAITQQGEYSAGKTLDIYSSEFDVAYSMVLYELLKAEFYFIEIVLKGEENRVWINDVSTPVEISSNDAYNSELRNNKVQAVKNEISTVVDSRPGGSAMVFVTLSTDNASVYHYAWDIAWDAVTGLEEKYGAKNYYSAEIFIMREE